MKKTELKNMLKPLIKECIKEVIFEDGTLSGIISEVAKGIQPVSTAIASPPPAPKSADPVAERMRHNAFSEQTTSRLQEHKTKLMEAIGKSSYNGVDLFAGTTPSAGDPTPQQSSHPLSGQSPTDPGVDIGALFGAVGQHWQAHVSAEKEGK